MPTLHDVDELPLGLPFIATIGVFDGVHLGHRDVLQTLTSAASELEAIPVVITFDPHPEAVVTGRAPRLLCTLEERVSLLHEAGIRIVVVQPFDEAFRQQSAAAFLDRLRLGRRLRGMVMSPESAFGHDRLGTSQLIRRLAEEEGWHLVETPLFELDGERVSSGRIRALLEGGDLAAVEHLLGRRFAVVGGPSGWVAGGVEDRIATVAIRPAAGLALPPAGAYAVHASWSSGTTRSTWSRGLARVSPAPTGGVAEIRLHPLDVPSLDRPAAPLPPESAIVPTSPGGGGDVRLALVSPIAPATAGEGDEAAAGGAAAGAAAAGAAGDVGAAVAAGDAGAGRPLTERDALAARQLLAGIREGTAIIRAEVERWSGVEAAVSMTGPGGARTVEGWWVAGRASGGPPQVELPRDLGFTGAIAWARDHARQVAVIVQPDGETERTWSAGEDPVEGLPSWPG